MTYVYIMDPRTEVVMSEVILRLPDGQLMSLATSDLAVNYVDQTDSGQVNMDLTLVFTSPPSGE